MENYSSGNSEIFGIEVDSFVKSTFLEMARWDQFLSILGFIILGLMLIGGVFIGAAMSKMPYGSSLAGISTAAVILIYIVIASVYFYPTYALLKYSTCMKTAINANNKQKFSEAVTYLKNVFKYIGILTVILLCLYGLVIVFMTVAAVVNH